jgi:ABC-type polysaccharide/polyol phosphate transport system ATPase subunit
MSERPVIEVEHVSKHYRLSGGTGSLKSLALDILRGGRKGRTLRALDDVNFSVQRGETLGIIGANGAGKSTLLALLTGTIEPTSGSIRTEGQISSLLELGAGFHPDLSGRENVFLYGAIMGLSRKQMQARFDAIVKFAELEEFIDQPVKHYSSGMYVRLGFAVAVEVNPEILLIDEVLAVGDATFQKKCLDKMREFRQQRKTMLIISHDLQTIQKVSDRILLLDHGQVLWLGDPQKTVENYRGLTRKRHAEVYQREWGTGEVRITGVTFHDADGAETDVFQWGGGLSATVRYQAEERIENAVFGFAISDSSGRIVHGSNTQVEGIAVPALDGEGCIELNLEELPMAKGSYMFSFSVHSEDHSKNYHRLDNCFPIAVECDREFEGYTYMPSSWRVGE